MTINRMLTSSFLPLFTLILALAFIPACSDDDDDNNGNQDTGLTDTGTDRDTDSGAQDFDTISQADAFRLRYTGDIPNPTTSSNLTVRIRVHADNQFDNAQNREDFETDFDVLVLRNGQVVTDADITVQAFQGPTITLRLDDDDDDDDDDDNEYEGSMSGYHRAYQFTILAGDDRIESIQFAGPSIHYFTNPTQDQTVPRTQDLEVTWQHDGEPADEARIDADGFDERRIDDTGTYTIPAARLGDDDDDDDDDELELLRINRMNLPDLAGDSSISISIENEVELRLE